LLSYHPEIDKGRPSERIKIYDYENHRRVAFLPAMMEQARSLPDAWPGSIEVGPKTALHILRNRVSLMICSRGSVELKNITKNSFEKCLACHNGARGTTKPKKGDALKGEGNEYMKDCGCPTDTALIELFIVKATAGLGPPAPNKAQGIKTSEFYFNPVNLTIVHSVIEILSGHTTRTLFAPESSRLHTTVTWALKKLSNDDMCDKTTRKELKDLVTHFDEVMSKNEDRRRKGKGKAGPYVEVDEEEDDDDDN